MDIQVQCLVCQTYNYKLVIVTHLLSCGLQWGVGKRWTTRLPTPIIWCYFPISWGLGKGHNTNILASHFCSTPPLVLHLCLLMILDSYVVTAKRKNYNNNYVSLIRGFYAVLEVNCVNTFLRTRHKLTQNWIGWFQRKIICEWAITREQRLQNLMQGSKYLFAFFSSLSLVY